MKVGSPLPWVGWWRRQRHCGWRRLQSGPPRMMLHQHDARSLRAERQEQRCSMVRVALLEHLMTVAWRRCRGRFRLVMLARWTVETRTAPHGLHAVSKQSAFTRHEADLALIIKCALHANSSSRLAGPHHSLPCPIRPLSPMGVLFVLSAVVVPMVGVNDAAAGRTAGGRPTPQVSVSA